jgi:hypothetical protein
MGGCEEEELRAKWSQPGSLLQDSKQQAAPAKGGNDGLSRVKVCPSCQAQGTIKVQSGFRVMTQACAAAVARARGWPALHIRAPQHARAAAARARDRPPHLAPWPARGQMCETCGGEGCLIDGKKLVDPVEAAKLAEDQKLAKVIALIITLEDLALLDAVESRLRANDLEGALSLATGCACEDAAGAPAAEAAPSAQAEASVEAPPEAGEKTKDTDAPPTADTALAVGGLSCQADADQAGAAIASLNGVVSVTVDWEKAYAKVISPPGFPTAA